MSGDQIRINGQVADGAITLKFDGVEYYGFTEIGSYKSAVEEKLLHGYSKQRGPRGRTKGVLKIEKFTVKGPVSSTRPFIASLKAKAADGRVSTPEFVTTTSFAEDTVTHTDVHGRCRVLEIETAPPAADSSDAVMETLTIQPLSTKRDGIEL